MMNFLLFKTLVRDGSCVTGIGNLLGEMSLTRFFLNPLDVVVHASVVCILVDNRACDWDSEPVKPILFSSMTVLALDIGSASAALPDPAVMSRSFRLT